MRAAITAAERGHDVTLLEAKERLGGILNLSDYGDPLKEDMNRFKNYMVAKTSKLANVKLNTRADAEAVKALNPDAVILAAGGSPIIPNIPGATGPNVILGVDAYKDADKTGQKVVVIGGGLVGSETGYFLAAEKGRDVTIVEMRDELGDPVDWRQTRPLLMWIEKEDKFTAKTGVSCKEITESGVIVVDKDGNEEFIEADTVILSVGFAAKPDLVAEFADTAPYFRAIGDCNQPGRILPATRDAYWAAMDVL
jgi:pyruvate/2-oxoglutarate dehydrogenase complex dihydrolipoamide dehydrogenase (E3) component